jgi:catechol 2,3-dioxygenase
MTSTTSIDPRVDVGHVHLRVADLNRSLAFYADALGLRVTGRIGDDAAFLAAGDYHHHVALNTWQSRGGAPAPAGSTGLHHVALRYPTRAALAAAVRALREHGVPIVGANDHGVNEAVYCTDPDGNGLELCWDRPRDEWPRTAAGDLALVNLPLDLEGLLAA